MVESEIVKLLIMNLVDLFILVMSADVEYYAIELIDAMALMKMWKFHENQNVMTLY